MDLYFNLFLFKYYLDSRSNNFLFVSVFLYISYCPHFLCHSVSPSFYVLVILSAFNSSLLSLHIQKRKSSSLLDARMAKIYRRQRHSRDGDDSASDDDDDEGLSVLKD